MVQAVLHAMVTGVLSAYTGVLVLLVGYWCTSPEKVPESSLSSTSWAMACISILTVHRHTVSAAAAHQWHSHSQSSITVSASSQAQQHRVTCSIVVTAAVFWGFSFSPTALNYAAGTQCFCGAVVGLRCRRVPAAPKNPCIPKKVKPCLVLVQNQAKRQKAKNPKTCY